MRGPADHQTTDFGAIDRQRLDATRQIDAACDAYESAITGGELLPFGGFLEGIDSGLHADLVRELTGIAGERLRKGGVVDPATELKGLNADLPARLLAQVDDFFAGAATAQYEAAEGGDLRAGRGSSGSRGSRGLQLRCPHCSNHVELIADAAIDAIDCTTCGSSFSLVDRSRETREAQTLQQIDRFELIARLGIGGFGTVWKARDTELERAVAVKIPRRGQLSSSEIEQFLREARSAAQLSHPNIVPVHEVGREGDSIFIVSDLVRGASLADQLTAKRPSPTEAARLCVAISDALDHAHQRGVIHRDLKPSNVMINDRGEPLLMDFGLAKREAEEVTMTMDGQIVGTPAYMSPEQASGRSAWVDRRTDIYSLGAMLFELLTGELPFRGNAQMQVQQRLTNDAPNARVLNRHLPIDLVTICSKCLEREPGRRYPTASAVRDELQRFLERRPIQARPLSLIQRAVRWAERNPSQALVASLVTVLAVAGPAAAILIDSQRDRLATLLREKDALIERRVQETAESRRANALLRSELDTWEGRANPSSWWPPTTDTPPKERMLASLLEHRAPKLKAQAVGESDLTSARRRLTLGLLNESSRRLDEAALQYRAAVPALERLREGSPRSPAIVAALLQTYDRLARLSASQPAESRKWIEASRTLAAAAAEEAPSDALAQAERLDRELRSAVVAGFENATNQLDEAATAERRLADLWPSTSRELYRFTCALAGAVPHLLALEETDAATSANATETKTTGAND